MSKKLISKTRRKYIQKKLSTLFISGVVCSVVTAFSYYMECDINEIILTAIISFLLPEIAIHNLSDELAINSRMDEHEENIKNYVLNNQTEKENHICSLLEHLADESFKRCTQYDTICKSCEKFKTSPNECNGLLRKFLYEDCKALSESIKDTEKGKYILTNDILNYHEIAIKYMLAFKSNMYGVIQTLNTTKPGEANYNSLDFYFLNKLLENVQRADVDSPNGQKYYEANKFEIRWLFVGNYDDIKDTYDYIFHVISKLPEEQQKNVKSFFKFYNINNNTFKQKLQGKTNLKQLVDDEKPSLGVFGNHFIFVESLNGKGEHGEIITTIDPRVPEVISLFEELISCSTELNYDELYNKYSNLIKNTPTHDTILSNRWSKNN